MDKKNKLAGSTSSRAEMADNTCTKRQKLTDPCIQRELYQHSSEIVDDCGDDSIDENVGDELKVALSEYEIQSIRSPWTSSLIVKLYGKAFGYQHFVSKLKTIWSVEEMKCINLGYGFYVVKFSTEEDRRRVLTEEPAWFIGNDVLIIKEWEPNFKPSKAAASFPSAPTWVRLPELPIEYHGKNVLRKIGNQIGRFLGIDSRTAARERSEFARLCIQVDLQKSLPRSIKIGTLEQLIEYEGVKLICPSCGIAGHQEETCPNKLVQASPGHPSLIEPQEIIPLSLLPASPTPSSTTPRGELSFGNSTERQELAISMEKPLLLHQQPAVLPPLECQAAPKWKYEVFVSFRGADTRNGFASHLFRDMEKLEIRHYRDTDQGERGLEVAPMLLEAIWLSRISLVLFSTNYADSRWCLDELFEIMKCNSKYKDQGHVVFPIFYNVVPSDVRQQKGPFGDGYRKCMEENGNQKAAAWRVALEQAGNLSGWDLNNNANGEEAKLIGIIMDELQNRVSFVRSPYFEDDAVGRCSDANNIISLLNIGSNDVRMIGIYGIKGIGKTTLAKLTCSRIFSGFGCVSFLHNIGDATEEDLVSFQRKLDRDSNLKRLMSYNNDAKRNISEITSKLQGKKILLVLDDVTSRHQVILLGGEREFLGPGSRILLTTSDEQLLDHLNVDEKYMVSPLGPEASLQLFSQHAFNRDIPEERYQQVSKNIVHYAGGLPVALRNIGLALSKKPSKDQWCHKILQKLVENPNLDSVRYELDSYQSLEPYGGSGGAPYNDNIYSGIRKMTIVVVSSTIESIIIDYDRSGSLVRSRKYGGPREGTTYVVRLNQQEYLTSISGHIKGKNKDGIIQSLLIQSNIRSYGPYGKQEGRNFSIDPKKGEKIVGFFGRFDSHLNSIGAYFQPISSPSQGPFGNKGDVTWDDEKHQNVRQIEVTFDSMIRSVSFLYDNYGHPVGPFTHGNKSNIGAKKELVKLAYPDEYLTFISGYTMKSSGMVKLQSLTIHTNRNSYGPFGVQVGNHFVCTQNNVRIVGFFGSCSSNGDLESIGAHVEPISHIYPLKCIGPFGGEDGSPWDDGQYTNLRQIVVTFGSCVDSVSFVYDREGQPIEASRHGGTAGGDEITVNLDSDEYLTGVSGYYGDRDAVDAIRSLTFESNKRMLGPYGGDPEGTYFQSPPNLGKIIGFFGRSGSQCLISMGAYLAPIFHIHPLKVIGPYGGGGGVSWDDGRHTHIRQIAISYGDIIDGIGCLYDDSGHPSPELVHHGGRGGLSYTVHSILVLNSLS